MAEEWPPFAVEPEVMAVLEALWTCGHGAYLVGGGVRDALLGLPVVDWDVTTDARPERILEIFPGGIYENRFGTVQARGVEITTFRREHRYADHRRPDSVTFSSDVYEDLARRDLTINAIAWGRQGPGLPARLVDPADGQGDLRSRLVRAVGDPGRRFDEDALRLLRAVRIAARLEFVIEPVTLAAMTAHASDIRWVSEERIGDEIRHMLSAPVPSAAVRVMEATGILAATIPELAAPTDGAGPGAGALARPLAVLDIVAGEAPGNLRLALAALLGETGLPALREALERLRVAHRDVEAVSALIAAARVDGTSDRSLSALGDGDIRRYLASLSADLVDDLLTLRRARALARDTASLDAASLDAASLDAELAFQARLTRLRDEHPALTLAELAVDGHDLRATLGVPEGPLVGSILERLLADVIEEPSLNQRVTLLARASLLLHDDIEHAAGVAERAAEGTGRAAGGTEAGAEE